MFEDFVSFHFNQAADDRSMLRGFLAVKLGQQLSVFG